MARPRSRGRLPEPGWLWSSSDGPGCAVHRPSRYHSRYFSRKCRKPACAVWSLRHEAHRDQIRRPSLPRCAPPTRRGGHPTNAPGHGDDQQFVCPSWATASIIQGRPASCRSTLRDVSPCFPTCDGISAESRKRRILPPRQAKRGLPTARGSIASLHQAAREAGR